MKTIEVDDEVYGALEKKVSRFGETPNAVIKRLLFNGESQSPRPTEQKQSAETVAHPLVKFVSTPEFAWANSKTKYFQILKFVHDENPKNFERLERFQVGTRIQISKTKADIHNSGHNTHPQELKGTPYWLCTNLSDERKRVILQGALRLLGYDVGVITQVLKSI